jgi:hypothetical protein
MRNLQGRDDLIREAVGLEVEPNTTPRASVPKIGESAVAGDPSLDLIPT